MKELENQKILERIVKTQLEEFATYCTQPIMFRDEKITDVFTNIITGSPLEFKFIGYDIYIKAEIDRFEGVAVLQTFEIVDDHDDHPKKKRLHIEEMDILICHSPMVTWRFLQDFSQMQTVGKKPDGSPMQVPIDRSNIINFNNQYPNMLFEVLKARALAKKH